MQCKIPVEVKCRVECLLEGSRVAFQGPGRIRCLPTTCFLLLPICCLVNQRSHAVQGRPCTAHTDTTRLAESTGISGNCLVASCVKIESHGGTRDAFSAGEPMHTHRSYTCNVEVTKVKSTLQLLSITLKLRFNSNDTTCKGPVEPSCLATCSLIRTTGRESYCLGQLVCGDSVATLPGVPHLPFMLVCVWQAL